MRVLIVDRHPVIRDALKIVFGREDDIEVVGEATSGNKAVKLAELLSPDVVFMDIRLRRMNGIQATRIIRERRPDTKVIVLTLDDSPASVVEAVRAGVSGYLLKDVGVGELVDAVRQVVAGESVSHPGVIRAFGEEVRLRDGPSGPQAPLTSRQWEILDMVASGATSKGVAGELGMSHGAVTAELERIFDTLGAEDRALALDRNGVAVCRRHRCCYRVILRRAAGLPLNRAGEWHFTWRPEGRVWRLHYPARRITSDRPVPKGVSPTAALVGGIPGTSIVDIAEEIGRIGFLLPAAEALGVDARPWRPRNPPEARLAPPRPTDQRSMA